MDFKGVYIFLVLAVIYSVNTAALPRDSGVVKVENVPNYEDIYSKVKAIPKQTGSETGYEIPGRVSCPHQEATEDSSCQEHCLPKGYSYGICVSGTCSCI